MDLSALDGITDPQALRALLADAQAIIAHKDALLSQRDQSIERKEALIGQLRREIARLRRLQFSARSERMDPEQRQLFEETMAADIAAVEAQLEALSAEGQSSGQIQQPRKASGRKPLPEHLARVEVRHEPACCTCPQCDGALVAIGEHVSERLACKPLDFYVRRDVYPQYACKACEQVVAEPVAAAIIERGQADASLLAQVTIAKYVDHLPLYRQEAIYARSGIELKRSTLAEWIGAIGVALQPLADRLGERLRQQPVLHADETPVAMLDPGAGKTKRAYLFAYRSAADPPEVVFDFRTSRSGAHVRQFREWRDRSWSMTTVATRPASPAASPSWAAGPMQGASGTTSTPTAAVRSRPRRWRAWPCCTGSSRPVVTWGPMRVRTGRNSRAGVDALKQWLDQLHPTVAGSSGTGKALAYTLRRWDALVRYADDGRYPIDNNPIENAIRSIALGRKNWLFAGSEQAGKRAAAIMSLLATAKANGIDPHAWLTDTLARRRPPGFE